MKLTPLSNLHQQAREKFKAAPELAQYEYLIFHDWPDNKAKEQTEHLQWVITAPIEKIRLWAKSLEDSARLFEIAAAVGMDDPVDLINFAATMTEPKEPT